MKRILSAVLAAVMAFTIFAVPGAGIAIADTEEQIKVTEESSVVDVITEQETEPELPPAIETVSIEDAVVDFEYTSYNYNGRERKPLPAVTLGDKVLIEGEDYTVTYTDNIYPGTATVTIEGINNYSGVAVGTFFIAKMSKLSLKSRTSTTIKLGWSKKSGVTGYEIEKSLSGKDAWSKCATLTGDKTTTVTIDKLSQGTDYDFRIRAYVKANNKNYYGEYSPILETMTKPGKVEFSSLTTNLKMQLKLKWKKEKGDGYQIYVARNSKFNSASKYTVKNSETLSKTLQAKKNNQNYYVKVRAYKMDGNTKVYGSWSKVKKIKTDGTGWGTFNSRKYYYRNGKPLKGTRTISGSQYFFGKNTGVLLGTSSTMYNTIKNKKSETKYLISVDRRKNRTVVYHKSQGEWVVKYYWKCSTGAPSDYSKISCTPSGSFSVPKKATHQKYFGDSHGYRCWYTTRIYKGYLFHSVLYQAYSGSRIQDGRLGYNISHGCIRLSKDNAYWLYKNIKPGTRVEILK